jgi:hypothetical protein
MSRERLSGFLMASKSPRARLLQIRDEIEGIGLTVRGLPFAQYKDSYMRRRAVERALQYCLFPRTN